MGGININTGGGGIVFGDGAVALGAGSTVNFGRAPSGRELSKAELANILANLGVLKAALIGADVEAATVWVARVGELEQSILSSGGRLVAPPARRLLAQISDAARSDDRLIMAVKQVAACVGEPLPQADIFISYKREDRAHVDLVAQALRKLRVSVWIDDSLAPGGSFTDEISEQIDRCRAQIVCWSVAACMSDWVRGEAEIGRGRGALICVQIEQCRIPPPFNMLHTEDLSGWRGEADHPAWTKTLAALGQKLGRDGLPALALALDKNDGAALAQWRRTHPDDPFSAEQPR
jgi:hypothetical protein